MGRRYDDAARIIGCGQPKERTGMKPAHVPPGLTAADVLAGGLGSRVTSGGPQAGPGPVLDGELVDDRPAGSPMLLPAVSSATRSSRPVLTADHVRRLLDDRAAADARLNALRNQHTDRAYDQDWDCWLRYHAWREEQGRQVPELAADVGVVVDYFGWLDDNQRYAPATIERRLVGLRVGLRRRGVELDPPAREALRALLRNMAADADRLARGRGVATPLLPVHLRLMSSAWDPATLLGARDRAAELVGWHMATRVEEAHRLSVGNVRDEGDGILVTVPGVKGRPPRTAFIPVLADTALCPVRAWREWIALSGLRSGAAWPRIHPVRGVLPDTRLSTRGLQRVHSQARAAVDLPASAWHDHRAGLITAARMAGKPVEKIMARSGHSPRSDEFWRYVRWADERQDNLSEDLGL